MAQGAVGLQALAVELRGVASSMFALVGSTATVAASASRSAAGVRPIASKTSQDLIH